MWGHTIVTVNSSNKDIIDTLDQIIEIHANGRVKREAAEKELVTLEAELKNKLQEIKVDNK